MKFDAAKFSAGASYKVEGKSHSHQPGASAVKQTNFFTQHIAVVPELRPCAYGKARHTTRGHAEHALRQRLTPGETRRFAVERCQSCNYFHVEVVGGVGPCPEFGVRPDKPAFDVKTGRDVPVFD